MRETRVQSLVWEDPLEKGKATYSSTLAWRIPWPVWSMGSQRVSPHFMACRILGPQSGTESMPPAVEAQSLNHWMDREVLIPSSFHSIHFLHVNCPLSSPLERKFYSSPPRWSYLRNVLIQWVKMNITLSQHFIAVYEYDEYAMNVMKIPPLWIWWSLASHVVQW